MGAKHFGARVARLEDPALLTGRGRFVDDFNFPGALHACFVRSPHAHARIRAIDTGAARAIAGVHAVLTADDLPARMATAQIPMLVPNPSIKTSRTQLALARSEVCYVGQTIAVVIAESRYVAEDAAAAVAIELDLLPAVSDCRDAARPGAARAHSDLASNMAASIPMSYGEVDAAFASAAHVFEEDLSMHRGGAMSLECRGVLASYDAVADMLTVWSATQTPHLCRGTLADLLERDLESIRVIAPFVGGGFGTKAPFYPEEAVVPAAAIKLLRPVTWQEDRREHFLSSTQERDQFWKVAIAVDRGGKILGLRGTMLHDTGAYLPWGIIVPYIAATTFPGPYVVPAYRIEAAVALTNRVPTTVVRGAGRPQAVFAMERLMDRVARELGLDRAEVRRRNMIRPEQMPYSVGLVFRDGKPLVYASGDFPKSQARALALSDYDGFRARQGNARAHNRYLGIGIGNYVEGTGLGPFEGVTVRVLPNGKVAVATGATTQGQGTRTTLSQIVADEVGCRIEDIVMTTGDTAAISQGHRCLREPPGHQRRLICADRRRQRTQSDRGARRPRAGRGAKRHRGRGRARHRPRRQQAFALVRRACPPFARHARLFTPRRSGARPRAHRLLRSAASIVLQWHACGGGRGRSADRRRDAARLHGCSRQRQRHQSADRGWTGTGRRRSRHRQCAVRVDEV